MDLNLSVKQLILEVLDIPDVSPEEIDDATPLFENDLLALDSLDAAELAVALQARFSIRIDNQDVARAVLHSVDSIADFIRASQAQAV